MKRKRTDKEGKDIRRQKRKISKLESDIREAEDKRTEAESELKGLEDELTEAEEDLIKLKSEKKRQQWEALLKSPKRWAKWFSEYEQTWWYEDIWTTGYQVLEPLFRCYLHLTSEEAKQVVQFALQNSIEPDCLVGKKVSFICGPPVSEELCQKLEILKQSIPGLSMGCSPDSYAALDLYRVHTIRKTENFALLQEACLHGTVGGRPLPKEKITQLCNLSAHVPKSIWTSNGLPS